MISFSPGVDIVVMHTPVSFACGIDGMCRHCRILLRKEPMEKGYFLFINKSKEQSRILWYDGQGFYLCTKRLSKGIFRNWPKNKEEVLSYLSYFEAQILLVDGNIAGAKCKEEWKKIS